MERHRNILYALVVLLLVFQIFSFVFLALQFSDLNSKIESEVDRVESSLSLEIKNKIDEQDSLYQMNFNELSLAINHQAAQQDDFERQIDLIKTGQEDFTTIIESAVKSVVAVMTEDSMGSGFFVSEEGHIVTNYHVLQSGDVIRILTYENNIIPADVLAVDRLRDLALLKIPGTHEALELVDSDKLQVGQKVIAIGNPLGLSFTVTEGIISGLEREGPNGIQEYIQSDVPLNPGNSGGPLIDTSGRVIGINNFKIGDAESLGFALESNSIRNSINSLLEEAVIPYP